MKKNTNVVYYLFQIVGFILLLNTLVYSQQPPPLRQTEESNMWWYLTLLALVAGLVGAIYWKKKSKKEETKVTDDKAKNSKKQNNSDGHTFDADEEMEWLRKNQSIVDRKRKKAPKKLDLPKTSTVLNSNTAQPEKPTNEKITLEDLESIPLPVFSFVNPVSSKPFDQLPISNDEALISAIEQTHDEYEEDEDVRDLALRILAAFRTRNSVEALSQIAIYDLSSSLRSKAIGVLTDFDHESVFETILLGCADPTREVRAAAARGLTRLSFDRAEAWTRLSEATEEGRVRQIARAALEGGFVERSFDRLIHRDKKHAYEAFVLLALIIKSGEVEALVDALKKHQDPKVRLAILHVFKVTKDSNALSYLYNMLEENKLPIELKQEIDKVIAEMSLVTV